MKHLLAADGLRFALVLASILIASFGSPKVEANGLHGYSNRDIRGNYSVTFRGEITGGPLIGHVVAIGIARANGRGTIVFSRTLNIEGAILQQTGDCTYGINRDGTGTVDCDVMTPGFANAMESFALNIVSRREVDFISTTPGVAVLGVGKKQSRYTR